MRIERRIMFALIVLTAALGTAAGSRARAQDAPARRSLDAAAASIDAEKAAAHVRFLADDKLEGRAAGTPGGRAAGDYLVERLRALGLEPAGDAGAAGAPRSYFQQFKVGETQCRNVLALRRGRDPARKDAHVVVGAHYDHVGRGEAGGIPSLRKILGIEKGPGEIHNGADDNASGTAALLEIARALAALEEPPARTVVVAFFDGEERGLWGSLRYVDAPALPLDRCAGMINLDMVGRSRGGHVQLLGSTSGTTLTDLIAAENARPETSLALEVDPYMVPNSDHFSFYAKEIPVAFFCTGLHPDYHRPGDDAPKINAPDLAKIARLAFRSAVRLADLDDAALPRYADVRTAPPGALALEFLNSMTGAEVFSDLQRDAYGPIEGAFVKRARSGGGAPALAVEFVTPRSPFAAAGLKAGDRIVSVNGRPLPAVGARARLLGAGKKREAQLVVEVERDGKKLSIGVRAAAPPKGKVELF